MNKIILTSCFLLAVFIATAIIATSPNRTQEKPFTTKPYVNEVLKDLNEKIAKIQMKNNVSYLLGSPRLMRIIYNDSFVEDFYLVNFSKKWVPECKGYTISGGEIIRVTYNLRNNSIKIKKFGRLKDLFKISVKFGDIRINYSDAIWMPLGWQYEFRISGSSKDKVELSLASENSSIFYTTDKNVNWISCKGRRVDWKCRYAGKLRCYASCEGYFRYVYWFRLIATPYKSAFVDVTATFPKQKVVFRIIVDQSEGLRCVEYFPKANICEHISYTPVSVVFIEDLDQIGVAGR